jgi:hypothetical protein
MMSTLQRECETALIAGHLVYSGSLGCNAVQEDMKDDTESLQTSATSLPIEELQSVSNKSQDNNINKELHTLH